MNPSSEQVKAYYNSFSRDRMLRYRIRSNKRIGKAVQFFCSNIGGDDVVLDIGCESASRQKRWRSGLVMWSG